MAVYYGQGGNVKIAVKLDKDLVLNPTVAQADFIIIDPAGTDAIIDGTPTVVDIASPWIDIPISAAESKQFEIMLQCEDVTATKAWDDLAVFVPVIVPGGDLAKGTATGGSTSTLVDTARTEADDFWNDKTLHLYDDSTGLWSSHYITDFVATTDTITFTPNAAAAVVSGDAYTIGAPVGVNVQQGNSVAYDPIDLADIESECNQALVALKLDHLVAVADADDPVDGSIIAELASATGDWSTFVTSTDSLEALSVLANGATGFAAIDTVVDAVKVKTDSLTFDVAGVVKSDLTHVHGDALGPTKPHDTP